MYIADTEIVIPSKDIQYMDGWLMLCQLYVCGSEVEVQKGGFGHQLAPNAEDTGAFYMVKRKRV